MSDTTLELQFCNIGGAIGHPNLNLNPSMKITCCVRSMFPRFTLLIVSAWFVCPAFNLSIRAQVSTEQQNRR